MFDIDPKPPSAAQARRIEPGGTDGSLAATFRDTLDTVWRRRRFVAAVAFGAILIAVLFTAAVPRRYTATAQLTTDPRGLHVVENDVTPRGMQTPDANNAVVETHGRILVSDRVLRSVVEAERLDADPDFNGSPPGPWGAFKTLVGRLLGREPGDPAMNALLTLQESVRARSAKDSYVISLSVTTKDGRKSARLAQAIIEAFRTTQAANRGDTSRRASDALAGRLDQLKERVARAEAEVQRFKAETNIVGANGNLVHEQQIADLSNQLSAARVRSSEFKARHEQTERLVKSGVVPDSSSDAMRSLVIAQLRSRYAEIKQQEDDYARNLGERHPLLISARTQAQSLRQQIMNELSRIAAVSRSDFEQAQAAELGLSRRLDALAGQAASLNQRLVQLRELEREAQASRAVYESFLNRTRELREQQDVDTSNIAVISPAIPPAQANGLSPMLLILVAGALGTTVGAIAAVAREQIDGRLHTGRQLTALTRLPVLAALPRPPGEGFQGALPLLLEAAQPVEIDWSGRAKPRSRGGAPVGAGQALFRLHDALRDTNAARPPRVVLVTAIEDDLGRSMASLNLALAAAARGERVLLVDASPAGLLTAAFGARPGATLAEVLKDRIALAAALVRDARSFAFVAGAATGLDHPGEDEIRNRLVEPARAFDLVLVDGGLVGADPNLRAFAEVANDILLVVQAGVTRLDRLDDARATLGSQAVKVLGAVLTEPARRFAAPAFAPLPIGTTAVATVPPAPDDAEARRRRRSREVQVLPIGRRAASG